MFQNANDLLKMPSKKGDNGTNGLYIVGTLAPTSSGILYPEADANDAYRITSEGLIGTTSSSNTSKYLLVGDVIYALTDNVGGTEASVGTFWIVLRGGEQLINKSGSNYRNNIVSTRGNHTIPDSDNATFNAIFGFTNEVVTSGHYNIFASFSRHKSKLMIFGTKHVIILCYIKN